MKAMKSVEGKVILLLLLIASVCPARSQDDRQEKFSRGVELYTSGDYEGALKEWTGISGTGFRSAALYYNIGNAHFKLNNVPESILFYERAKLLKPGDENISYNLQIAKTLVVDKFDEIPELFFVRWFDFISLVASGNGWAVLSIVTFVVFLLLLSAYIYSSRYRYKVLGFWTAILFLLISASSLAFSLRNKSLVYNSDAGVIFAPSVNGKSSPDDSGTDLFILHEGSKVDIEDEVGGWYEIKLSDGNKGWIPKNTLEII